MLTDAQKKAVKKYQAANYEFVKIRLNKGERDIVKDKAKKENLSLNEYIRVKILEI